MRIDATLTTAEVLREIGERLRSYRLQQNIAVEELARDAGVGVRTVVRAEAGERPTLETVVKILRALGRLDVVDAFLPIPLASPILLAERKGTAPQRAGAKRQSRVADTPTAAPVQAPTQTPAPPQAIEESDHPRKTHG